MSSEDYRARRDTHQKIQLEELAQQNAELTIQLHDADVEVARLRLQVTKLENGQIELTAKLQDEDNEIGRLSMVINRHKQDLERMVPPKKKY